MLTAFVLLINNGLNFDDFSEAIEGLYPHLETAKQNGKLSSPDLATTFIIKEFSIADKSKFLGEYFYFRDNGGDWYEKKYF